jgi:hypothetical protein
MNNLVDSIWENKDNTEQLKKYMNLKYQVCNPNA